PIRKIAFAIFLRAAAFAAMEESMKNRLDSPIFRAVVCAAKRSSTNSLFSHQENRLRDFPSGCRFRGNGGKHEKSA
ncbi:MAG: hypothetical protein IJU50_03820, partial [Lachnospiraceae bacterium]|nr:hypothetical protein [Lachnospiraceae bacterium]